MRFPRIITLLWIMGTTMLPLTGQLISVKSEVSSDSMMIGDQVVYRLVVDAADNIDFVLPDITDTLSREIEVLFPIASDTTLADGRRVVDQKFMITGFDPGLQLIPSQSVFYQTGDVVDTARSMPLMIQVYEPLVDTSEQIRPIKPPINTPVTLRELLPWLALGIGGWFLGTFIYAFIWMQRQKRRDPEIFALKPQEPAHVIAFRELDSLKEKKLWEAGEVKEFYTRLTEITRSYIERQYGIPALERTTQEILQSFRKVNTENGILDEMLSGLLELADLVKFAKEDPLPIDNQSNLNNAYLFVQKTYPLFYREETVEPMEEEDG